MAVMVLAATGDPAMNGLIAACSDCDARDVHIAARAHLPAVMAPAAVLGAAVVAAVQTMAGTAALMAALVAAGADANEIEMLTVAAALAAAAADEIETVVWAAVLSAAVEAQVEKLEMMIAAQAQTWHAGSSALLLSSAPQAWHAASLPERVASLAQSVAGQAPRDVLLGMAVLVTQTSLR